MKKIAVIISGCGFRDGAEIFETTFALLELERNGVEVKVFAPDKKQYQIINHLTGQEMKEERSVLIEAARIARGKIQPLSELQVSDFDALILPGGFGVVTNLSDIALKQEKGSVIKELKEIIVQFYKLSKPIGAMCIAPAVVASVLKEYTQIKITLGEKNKLITSMGAIEETCDAYNIVVDEQNKLVTTPAFMLDAPLSQIHTGISNLVTRVIKMI